MAPTNPLTYRCPEFVRQSMLAIGDDRLWVMCLLVGFANTALRIADLLTGTEYITSLGIVFSVYTGARVIVANKGGAGTSL